MTIDIGEILKILPHRYPFLLVDKILEMEVGQKIVGIKNVTINEPFFQGHFPGFPIMPGVLMIEAMAQVAAILAYKSRKGEEGDLIFLAGVDKAKFREAVFPGDQLIITTEVIKARPPFFRLKGNCHVDEKLRCEAEILAVVQKGGTR
ncbi:MAG: 3-hydroxyacyl-ACP dehydratase FabZ [Nitrospirae bacterium]|nr:3-hydroxyacyl-ACP dehydratase FabZ [Candidatus Troglogloeales bacterium]MBI3598628.1 3-hydroxyacyl-ACP dehydratase FabZ [Candidatus Troglogloeales bacterium]